MPLMNNISGSLISIQEGHLLEKPVRLDCERLPEWLVQPALSDSMNTSVDIFSIHYISIFPGLSSP